MNGITSMQRSSTSYADYGKFASGKKVNRAADGAAELAIIQKQETQTRSYKVGENNIGAAKDMLNVADGAMSGITAVSYTHLDVYKRQIYCTLTASSSEDCAIFREKACSALSSEALFESAAIKFSIERACSLMSMAKRPVSLVKLIL